MRKITKQVLIDCADNLLFNLSDIELEKLEKDFENFISQIEFLKALDDIDSEVCTTFPYEYYSNYLRDDVPTKPLKAKDVLKNVNNKYADMIKVSKVIGE